MMRGPALSRWTLRRTILTVLLPALAVIGSAALWATYRTAVDAANSAYDRSLLGAIKAIDANISTASGGIAVELPYRMFEFFQLTAGGEVYFRVATEDGLTEVGSPDLPSPPRPLQTGLPQFYDALYFGEKLRIGAYARTLEKPFPAGAGAQDRIVLQVAESLTSRSEFIARFLWQTIIRDFLSVFASAVLLAVALSWALRPLSRLRNEVVSRSPLDLTAIDASSVPADVRPLVDAINHHTARTQQIIEGRRRFLDDASHQLRTPLATLRTQLDYVLRERDPQNIGHALKAVSQQLDDAIRATNQLLALARADAAELAVLPVDLALVADQVARAMVLQAREKNIDLELVGTEEPLPVLGHSGLLREAVMNLLDNAVRFTPENGLVTLELTRSSSEALLTVRDTGPGIPPDDLPRMGERFFRARNASGGGTGLGLAIARAVAERHNGNMIVRNASTGTGCIVTLELPLASSAGIDSLTTA